jgi:predicted RecA/RadA family phage recombinase
MRAVVASVFAAAMLTSATPGIAAQGMRSCIAHCPSLDTKSTQEAAARCWDKCQYEADACRRKAQSQEAAERCWDAHANDIHCIQYGGVPRCPVFKECQRREIGKCDE